MTMQFYVVAIVAAVILATAATATTARTATAFASVESTRTTAAFLVGRKGNNKNNNRKPFSFGPVQDSSVTTTPSVCVLQAGKDDDASKKEEQKNDDGNPLSFILNPYESKIPKEVEKEIYEAEGNTAAAKDRTQRIILYALIAFAGVLAAFFNAFLTEIVADPGTSTLGGAATPFFLDNNNDVASVVAGDNTLTEALTLKDIGFGWTESNFLFQFLFRNKIGGGLALLVGCGAGLLAEAEYDTRRKNAEAIWEEIQRRKAKRENPSKKQRRAAKKKRTSGKQKKRLGALSEVVMSSSSSQGEKDDGAKAEGGPEETRAKAADENVVMAAGRSGKDSTAADDGKDKGGGGIFGAMKGFYEKADAMAASQALLLNKKLEDEGLIDKITDESGLKVVGREEAKKIQQQQGQEQQQQQQQQQQQSEEETKTNKKNEKEKV